MIASGREDLIGLNNSDGIDISRPLMDITPYSAKHDDYCVSLRLGGKKTFLAALKSVVEKNEY